MPPFLLLLILQDLTSKEYKLKKLELVYKTPVTLAYDYNSITDKADFLKECSKVFAPAMCIDAGPASTGGSERMRRMMRARQGI